MNKIILLITLVFFFNSCQLFNRENSTKIVSKWRGKEIIFPVELTFKVLDRDTICKHLLEKSFKIFVYIDSIGCTSCRLEVLDWKIIIDSCRQQQINVGFIFAVHSSDFKRFEYEIRVNEFDYPIIYDYHNQFDKLNRFPPAPYNTFLLDKDNKVCLVGSPINNPKMWELYKKEIIQSQ